ncbi:Tissue factor pathway inhibitor, partial [Plecturocebus cupreus]
MHCRPTTQSQAIRDYVRNENYCRTAGKPRHTNAYVRLGAVAHACNPALLGGRGGRIMRSSDRYHPGQHDTELPPLKFRHTFCAFKADDGPCKAWMKRYFFNVFTRQCEEFIYGGCEGNQNRFDSLEECEEMCAT